MAQLGAFEVGVELGRNRGKPADPQAIMVRRARERHAERLRDRSPESWGVSAEIVHLETSKASVDVKLGERRRILFARRIDAFESLHRAKKYEDGVLTGGISDPQFAASERHLKDWMMRIGVRTGGDAPLMPVDACNDGQGLTQLMIDAGRRIELAYRGGRLGERVIAGIGRTPARVLQALIEPFISGEMRVWQAIVGQVTGEKDPHARAAVVRMSLQQLVDHYDLVDGREAAPDEHLAPRRPIRVWQAE